MRTFYSLLIALIAIVPGFSAHSQSVLNPADSVITYDSTKPPVQPQWGQIGKWVRTVRMNWDTRAYKCYIYKGVAFRLKFPKTYNPNVNDGKKYPLLVFFHGLGEKDTTTDNEFHLLWGAQYFSNSVDDGTFDGYVLFMQSQGFWGDGHYDIVKELIDYMVVNNKLDPFHVVDHGLSSGGQGTWECYFKYPTYINAAIPMSSVAWYYSSRQTVDKVKFSPIWNLHGGQDGSPAPYTAFQVYDSMQAAGANYRNTMFPYDNHNSWENTWREPDFWPFINRVYASNPWALYGKKDYCSLTNVADTIGIVAGYDEYQWRKDGVLITGATGNKIYVTQAGTYDARVRRGTLWSDWSKIPVVIRSVACATPPIKIEAENYINMAGIRTENTADSGGGLNVGWQESGDWMEYLFSTPSAGTYTLSFRVATPNAGAQFQIRKPEGTVLSTVTLPSTGSFQTWQTVITQMTLPAGEQRLRIYTSDGKGSGWNLNWWQIQSLTANNKVPTVNAGADQTITLPATSAILNGNATDSDGTISTYSWTTVSGPSSPTFSNSSAASTTISDLVQGNYVLRLTVIDNGGAVASDDINVSVNVASSANTIHIEAENYTAMSGIQTENTGDPGGGLDVGWQENGDWMDYAVNVPTAGTYTVNFRVATVNTGVQAQLKNSAGTVLTTITVPNTGGWQTYQTVSALVTLPAGQQTLRIYTADAKGSGWNINWWEIVLGGTATNQPPTVNAGADQTITLPTSTANLNGTASDPDGTISSYLWTRVSGPSTVSFSNANALATTVSGLVQGTYTLRLTVTDNKGATASDDIIITVNASSNQPPTVNAGADQNLLASSTSTTLTGTASDPDGTISTYAWTKLSGPTGSVITSPSSASTTVTGLVQGSYVFRLTVTDNKGLTASDDVAVTIGSTIHIEAENYSAMSGIQTENTADAGGGLDVGWQENGDWMDYAVNVATAGTYTVNFRVATVNTGVQAQLKNSAGTVLTTITVPNTGGWQTFQTVSAQVTLPAGQQTLRIYTADAKGSGWNINWWEIAPPPAITYINVPARIQAENYTNMFGIQTENTADAGGGLDVGWQENGDWMDYAINVPTAGTYTVNFRVATVNTGVQAQLRNASGTVLTTVTIPNTGWWQTFQTVSAQVTLPAGQQTLRIYTADAKGSGWNINWWEIVSNSAGVTQLARDNATEVLSTSATVNVYPNPVVGNFTLSVDNNYTGKLSVRIVNSNGMVIKAFDLQKTLAGTTRYNLSVPDLKSGVYFIQANMSNWKANKQLIKQ